MNFKDFIITDRENRNSEKFEGTFLDYLEIVKQIQMLLSFLIKDYMILL